MPIYMNNAHQSSFNEMAKHLSQYHTKKKSHMAVFHRKKRVWGGGRNGSQNNKLNQGQL